MRRGRTQRGGYALVLVIGLVAAVSVLGLTYIDDNALTVQGASNLARMSRARYIAESGVEQALFWLGETNPPNANSDGYWPGATRQLVDATGYDYYDVTVTRDAGDQTLFTVVSTGYVMKNASTSLLSRRTTVRVKRSLDPMVTLNHALLVDGTSTLASNQVYNGSVHANGSVVNNGTINGNLTATGFALYGVGRRPTGTVAGWQAPVVFPDFNCNHYTSYRLAGQTYTASVYTEDEMNASYAVPVSALNPGKVVYAGSTAGYVRLKNNATINGTLVVQGHLYVNGRAIVITPQPGFPAVVVSGNLYLKDGNTEATFNGAVLIRGSLATTGATASNGLTVNGGIRQWGAQTVAAWTGGGLTVNQSSNAARNWLYDFTSNAATTGDVSVQSWSDR